MPEVLTLDILAQLRRTPTSKWHLYALLMPVDGDARLLSRGALSAWCRDHDLPTMAREATSRRVGKGGILALVVGDGGVLFRVLGGLASKGRAA